MQKYILENFLSVFLNAAKEDRHAQFFLFKYVH